MATDYLVYKWRLWWKSLHVHHDDTISESDMDECNRNYFHLSHLSEERSAEVKSVIVRYWRTAVLRGRTGKITEAEFVELLKHDYSEDKAKFRSEFHENAKLLFDVFDLNKDGFLSEDEMVLAFRSFGHDKESNLAAEKEGFQMYNPVDGKVPLGTVVEALTIFVCNEDDSVLDIMKESLEKGA